MSNSAALSVVSNELALTFAALGDARRIVLITRLHGVDSLSVSELCEGMEVSRQAVSKHLTMLTDARLVSKVKAGRETRYSLEKQKFDEAGAFLDLIGQKWEGALDRLKMHLDE
jgi:DNA-binding transcriptional ArsR family regulator